MKRKTNILSTIANSPKHTDDTLQYLSEGNISPGYWTNIKKEFRKNKLALYSLRLVYLLIALGVLADFLANEKPLICNYNNHIYFPVLRSYTVTMGINEWPAELQNVNWEKLDYKWSVFPPIPYMPGNIDEANVHSVGPFEQQHIKSIRWRHWLGTDELGHDIFAAMIHGARVALLVGFIATSIAALIGIVLGSLAGYFGDEKLKISRISFSLNIIFFILAVFYAFGLRAYTLCDALASSTISFLGQLLLSIIIFFAIITIANIIFTPLKKLPMFKKKISIPIDTIISRCIDIMLSIPVLFLIIAISAIAKPSLMLVVVVIGSTTWTGIARFARAELLRIRNLEYIEAARVLGYSEVRTIFRHALPNALSPMLIAIAFGIAGAILTEATLSFLGIGVPADTITWGSLLAEARYKPTAWWLAVFPGLAIFITVTAYNLLGEGLTDAMDPRLREQ